MLHENNIVYEVGQVLKKIFEGYEDRIIYEGNVKRRKIDIVLDNYRLIVEVEPNKSRVYSSGSGVNQLDMYAEEVINYTGYDSVLGLVVWQDEKKEIKFNSYEYKKEDKIVKSIPIHKEDDVSVLQAFLLSKKDELLKGKLKLTANNFKYVFSKVIREYLEDVVEILKRNLSSINHLYLAYSNALSILYAKETRTSNQKEEEQLIRLYAIHTLLYAIAVGVLTNCYCRIRGATKHGAGPYFISSIGKPFFIGLPFLEWFSLPGLTDEDKKFFSSLSDYIERQIERFDFNTDEEVDIFRLLYEEFIESKDRWTFGEYYTPMWLVNITLDIIGRDKIKKNLVLDPFCGSGTFLVACFYEKIKDRNKTPEDAIDELIGFDINPLAVSLARAELIFAYLRELYKRGDEFKNVIPKIYYVNSAEVLSERQGILFATSFSSGKKSPIPLYTIEELLHLINISILESSKLTLKDLPKFEYDIKRLLENLVSKEQDVTSHSVCDDFKKKYGEIINLDKLNDFVQTYGDGVWSISIVSLLAFALLKKIDKSKQDLVVVSNPPWKSFSDIKGSYGEVLRNYVAKAKLNVYNGKKFVEAVNKGDLSSLMFHAFCFLKPICISLILPATVSYDEKNVGVGKLLTYKASDGRADVYFVKFDAFGHGILPTIVKKDLRAEGGNVYVIEILDKKIRKETEVVKYSIKGPVCSFKEHIDEVLQYFISSKKEIANSLKVEDVFYGWTSIPALKGILGTKDKAGLLVCDKLAGNPTKMELAGLSFYFDPVDINLELSDISQMIYYSTVYPFRAFPIEVLIPERFNKEDLKKALIELSKKDYATDDRAKILKLIKDIDRWKKDPVRTDPDYYYVVYRNHSEFWAACIRGSYVLHQDISAIKIRDENAAYYYTSVLNWLVVKAKGKYVRNNHGRPLKLIVDLSLAYEGEEWQLDLASLAKEIEKEIEDKLKILYDKWLGKYCRKSHVTEGNKEETILLQSSKWSSLDEILKKKVDSILLENCIKTIFK